MEKSWSSDENGAKKKKQYIFQKCQKKFKFWVAGLKLGM